MYRKWSFNSTFNGFTTFATEAKALEEAQAASQRLEAASWSDETSEFMGVTMV